jgi:hypothetical protein
MAADVSSRYQVIRSGLVLISLTVMALTGSRPVKARRAVCEWRLVGVGEAQVEGGLELSVFPDAEVSERFVADGKDLAVGSAVEAAGDTSLDDQVGAIPANLSHNRPGGGEASDAGDQGGDAMGGSGMMFGRRGGRMGAGFQQEVDCGLNFERRGGGQ